MLARRKLRLAALFVCLSLACGSAVLAQDVDRRGRLEEDRDESWYAHEAGRPHSRTIIHQKAQERAAQRQFRLASLSWYGMSNGRPTAAPTPFTSLYSPVWQVPGGRPFAWYWAARPTYVIYAQ